MALDALTPTPVHGRTDGHGWKRGSSIPQARQEGGWRRAILSVASGGRRREPSCSWRKAGMSYSCDAVA